jgi:CBS domain containing-hemolysin-like protein
MKWLLFSLLILLNLIFYMLEIGFKSFSRISLAGFLDDYKNERIKRFDFIGHYDMVRHALGGFSFFWQLSLFVYSFILFEPLLANPIYRFIVLIVVFLFIFNFFLYTVSYSNREGVLKRLIILTPIAWTFFFPAKILFSIFLKRRPEDKENDQDDPSEKELEVFFEEGAKEGVLESEDKEMIESVLEFGDTLVKEIMTPRVDMAYIDMEAGLDELITLINEKKKSRYPVISGRIDNIEGIILSKDVFDYWKNKEKNFSIKKILRKAFFIPETMRIMELLKELQKSKQKFAIVADEFGGISGVATMEDIIEEIVGEIHDEYDEDTEPIIRENDYFIVKGDTDIHDLIDTLKIKIDEDEDYQTAAGLMSFLLGKIPGPGDQAEVDGHTFEVTDVEKNRVKKVRIFKKETSG